MFLSKLKFYKKLCLPKAFSSVNNKKSIEATEFFSVCSQIILHSGNIIKQASYSYDKSFKSIKNEEDEPVTEADIKIQALVMAGLRNIWPNIKIIGEEEEEPNQPLGFSFDSLDKDKIPRKLFEESRSTEFDLEKAIVWVDPLDGTKEFIKGALDCVTTLIGISVDNKAKLGIIGKYFSEDNNGGYKWEPRCYFALADNPNLYYIDYLNTMEIKQLKPNRKEESNNLVICTTQSHFTANLQTKIDKVNADKVLKIGGAGNKILAVIEGKADCLFSPVPGMKKWDICAGEAILSCVGGVVSDGKNNKIEYKEDKSTWLCKDGMIASISKEKHQRIFKDLLF